jgi:hypothetical protein
MKSSSHKYKLGSFDRSSEKLVKEKECKIPNGRTILDIEWQGDDLMIWALVSVENVLMSHKEVIISETGEELIDKELGVPIKTVHKKYTKEKF